MNTIDPARLKPGYILARQHFEIWDRLATRIGLPRTEFVHFSILVENVGGHWVSIEQQKVTAFCSIEIYSGQNVRIYSVPGGDAAAALNKATELAIKQVPYERFNGWASFARVLPAMLRFWLSRGFKPIPWSYFPNKDIAERLNCLSFLRACYPDIVPGNIGISPAALEQMYREGKLMLEQEGVLP